jgi:hypothetical protein
MPIHFIDYRLLRGYSAALKQIHPDRKTLLHAPVTAVRPTR